MIRRLAADLISLLVAIPAALWIIRREKLILKHGRPLRRAELDFASEIGIADPGAIRILSLPQIPSPLGGLLAPLENKVGFSLGSAAGVTLGYGIYLAEDHESLPLIRHELVHVRQYERLGGPLPFIRRYLFECLACGYDHSPLEREAVDLGGN